MEIFPVGVFQESSTMAPEFSLSAPCRMGHQLTSSAPAPSGVVWSKGDQELFENGMKKFPEGMKNRWKMIASLVPGKSELDCIHHYTAMLLDECRSQSGMDPRPLYEAHETMDLPTKDVDNLIVGGQEGDNHQILVGKENVNNEAIASEEDYNKIFAWEEDDVYHILEWVEGDNNIQTNAREEDNSSQQVSSRSTATPVVKRRKRTNPWTEEEHMRFLQGVVSHGWGRWKKIATQSVLTRTMTQVASHAQKYSNRCKAKSKGEIKRKSIHDITLP